MLTKKMSGWRPPARGPGNNDCGNSSNRKKENRQPFEGEEEQHEQLG